VNSGEVTAFRHTPCDLCGTGDFVRLGKPKASNRMKGIIPVPPDISVVRCTNCGFYYTNPMPFWREEDLQKIYDATYFPPMTRWWKRVKTQADPKRRLDAIETHADCQALRFLEVGCGLGYGLEDAVRRGWDARGQDVSPFFAEQVESRLGVQVFVGQLAEACYPEHSFDAVYIDSVLEHLPSPMQMLREVHRILRPGGVAHLTVTNESALSNTLRSLLLRIAPLERSPILSPLAYPIHLVGFTPDTLKLACQSTGFEMRSLEVRAGASEWRKYGMRSMGPLLSNFVCSPMCLIGEMAGRGISIDAVVSAHK
jgi:SAM-dependent methyltransferase